MPSFRKIANKPAALLVRSWMFGRKSIARGNQRREEWKPLLLTFLLSVTGLVTLLFFDEFQHADKHLNTFKRRVSDTWRILTTPGLVGYRSGRVDDMDAWSAAYKGEAAWSHYPTNRSYSIPRPTSEGWDVRAANEFLGWEAERFSEIEFTTTVSQASDLLKRFRNHKTVLDPEFNRRIEVPGAKMLGAKWTDGSIIYGDGDGWQTMLINSRTGRVFIRDSAYD